MDVDAGNVKISLPKFLKIFTSNNVPVPKAMEIAGKIYKEYNTPTLLSMLSDVKLIASGIGEKEDRKAVLVAIRKAGYAYRRKHLTKTSDQAASSSAGSSPTTLSAVQQVTTPEKRKRKRADDTNEFLPNGPVDEVAEYGNLEFKEILDEEALKSKFTVVNRAPLMTAWATLVAERLHFRKEEALSIATVYTEMNAVSKGISLGIYEKGKEKGLEAARAGAQPYVDLIGRRPLYKTQTGEWRALSNGTPVPPSTAFSYICRALRQTTPHIMGALRLLAESYSPQELNSKAWGLYAEFRPAADGWGKRSEVHCDTILALRKKLSPSEGETSHKSVENSKPVVNIDQSESSSCDGEKEPEHKKTKPMSLEEYEAALDEDTTFQDIDLENLSRVA